MKRRRVMTGLLFLILGVLVNVAIAWSCAMWVITDNRVAHTVVPRDDLNDVQWTVVHNDGFGATQILAISIPFIWVNEDGEPLTDFVPIWSKLPAQTERAAARAREAQTASANARQIQYIPADEVMQKGYGWPLRAMYWNWEGNVHAASREGDRFSLAISLAQRPSGVTGIDPDELRALPLGVIPLGFIANSTLFGLALLLPIRGPFALRRYLRKRRGACLKCRYLTGESAVCTECGAPVAARAD